MSWYIWYSPLRILGSSYRKLAWLGFEPTTTEFRSDALTDWGIRPWVQLVLKARFVQPLQFHCLFCVRFYCLRQWAGFFELKVCLGNHMSVVKWADTYGIIIIHFIYPRLQVLVKNIIIQIDKEIHLYH